MGPQSHFRRSQPAGSESVQKASMSMQAWLGSEETSTGCLRPLAQAWARGGDPNTSTGGLSGGSQTPTPRTTKPKKPMPDDGNSLQLLPPELIKSRLGACATPVSAVRENHHEINQAGLSQRPEPHRFTTPVAWPSTKENYRSFALQNKLDETSTRVNDAGDIETSFDPSAPYSVPLHLIQAQVSQGQAGRAKSNLSTLASGASELGSSEQNFSDNGDIPIPRLIQCSTQKSPAHNQVTEQPGVELVRDSEIGEWLEGINRMPAPTLPSCEINNVYNSQCAFDTDTGELLPPQVHPQTFTNLDFGPSGDMGNMAWRRVNQTTNLRITQEVGVRNRMAGQVRVVYKEAKVKAQQQQQEQPQQQLQLPGAEEEEDWPEADCLIRPATPADFQGIAKILDLESQDPKNPQVFESEAVRPEQLSRLHQECREGFRPFIVAIKSTTNHLDHSKRPKDANKQNEEFAKYTATQTKERQNNVVGFAYVTDTRLGTFGEPCAGARYTGQIKLMVHPDHRRKLYGSALLDRIVSSVAIFHRSLVDYQWDCPNPGSVYEQPASRNRRKYARAYINTAFAGKDDPDIDWVTKMLEKFDFKRVAWLESALRTNRGDDSQWLDLAIWELEGTSPQHINDDPALPYPNYG